MGGCAAPREEVSSPEQNELPVQSKAVLPEAEPDGDGSSEDILRLHFVDVGQGDAIMLQCPGGENILVDGGDKAQGEMLCAYLRECGATRYRLVTDDACGWGMYEHLGLVRVGERVSTSANDPGLRLYVYEGAL